jgi:hypothetical protein
MHLLWSDGDTPESPANLVGLRYFITGLVTGVILAVTVIRWTPGVLLPLPRSAPVHGVSPAAGATERAVAPAPAAPAPDLPAIGAVSPSERVGTTVADRSRRRKIPLARRRV